VITAGALAVAGAMVLGGCSPKGKKPVDLVTAEAAMVEASVAGRDRPWVVGQTGKPIRIDDEVRRTLPASPPSRLRYTVDIPPRARLNFALGIPEERQGQPAVEFTIKVRQEGREKTVFTQLMDPLQRPRHRRWLPAEVDLRDLAAGVGEGGDEVHLLLEVLEVVGAVGLVAGDDGVASAVPAEATAEGQVEVE